MARMPASAWQCLGSVFALAPGSSFLLMRLGKQQIMTWAPISTWDTWMEYLALDFALAQPWLQGVFGE